MNAMKSELSWKSWVYSKEANRHYVVKGYQDDLWHHIYKNKVKKLLVHGEKFCIVIWREQGPALVIPIEWFLKNVARSTPVNSRDSWDGHLGKKELSYGQSGHKRWTSPLESVRKLLYDQPDDAESILQDQSKMSQNLVNFFDTIETSLTAGNSTTEELDQSETATRDALDRVNTWWVNQGATYRQETQGNLLWAPKSGKKGQEVEHWRNMAFLGQGDVVFHYASGSLRGLSLVISKAIDSTQPPNFPTKVWSGLGYLVEVKFAPLRVPIPLSEIDLSLRLLESDVFYRNGKVQQKYLSRISRQFTSQLATNIPLVGILLSSLLGKRKRVTKDEQLPSPEEEEDLEISKDLSKISLKELRKMLLDYSSKGKVWVNVNGKRYARDTVITAALKMYRGFRCQICNQGILKKNGELYVEAAHIKAKKHGGSEEPRNIIVLCPNHHKEFDYGDRIDIKCTASDYEFQLNGKSYHVTLSI